MDSQKVRIASDFRNWNMVFLLHNGLSIDRNKIRLELLFTLGLCWRHFHIDPCCERASFLQHFAQRNSCEEEAVKEQPGTNSCKDPEEEVRIWAWFWIDDINLGSIAHANIVRRWVHELHFANVETHVSGGQPLKGEVHFASTRDASADGIIQEGRFIFHSICHGTHFSHMAVGQPQHCHPGLGGFVRRCILTHKAGDTSAAGQDHCRLGHMHCFREDREEEERKQSSVGPAPGSHNQLSLLPLESKANHGFLGATLGLQEAERNLSGSRSFEMCLNPHRTKDFI